MAQRILIVVDMQVDFVSGTLGSAAAEAIVPAAVRKAASFDGRVIYTLDTHQPDYPVTQEGRLLPVAHCLKGTAGWELIGELRKLREAKPGEAFEKETFGSRELALRLREDNARDPIASIELIGLCTDICVVSNALLLKAFLPEVPIFVDPECCAGTSRERHQAALDTLRSCQIIIE